SYEYMSRHAIALPVIPSIVGVLWALHVTLACANGSEAGVLSSECMPQVGKAIEITLPGASARAGIYPFQYVNEEGSELTSKVGFLLGNGQFLYVEGGAPDVDAFDVGGDTNFGIYGNYLVLDSFAVGTSYSRRMFLFTYSGHSIRLLDVINDAYGVYDTYSLRFMTAYDSAQSEFRSQLDGYKKQAFNWMDIKQHDQDTNPEIRLLVFAGNKFDPLDFSIFVEVVGDRLRVDLNPRLYEPLFVQEVASVKSKSYYVYAFLARKLTIKEIEAELQEDKELSAKIVPLLQHAEEWNEAFHSLAGGKPRLIECNVTRR
ncbi:MAG: hypothetical protein ACREYC_04065, partial [Gammaproteobacteria bacterium]